MIVIEKAQFLTLSIVLPKWRHAIDAYQMRLPLLGSLGGTMIASGMPDMAPCRLKTLELGNSLRLRPTTRQAINGINNKLGPSPELPLPPQLGHTSSHLGVAP